jgi:hypothetical protein
MYLEDVLNTGYFFAFKTFRNTKIKKQEVSLQNQITVN